MDLVKYFPDVVTLQMDESECNGCRKCIQVCPQRVFGFVDKKAFIETKDACMECGACASNCESGALSVVPGVGCAYGIIMGYLRGTAPTCGCNDAGCC